MNSWYCPSVTGTTAKGVGVGPFATTHQLSLKNSSLYFTNFTKDVGLDVSAKGYLSAMTYSKRQGTPAYANA